MKKILCLLAVLIGVSVAVYADDVPYRQQRRDHFGQLPINSETTVFLGNSITNFGVWPEIFTSTTSGASARVVNRGISGNFSKEVMAYFNLIIDQNPKAIYLMIGINDVSEQDDIVPSVERMLQIAKEVSPSTKIYVQSILPTTYSGRGTIPTTINPQLILLCDQYSNATYVDVYTKMNAAGVANVMDDTLHPTWKGYRIWANVIEEQTGLKSNFDQSATYTYFTSKNFVDRMLGSYSILPVTSSDILMLGDGIVQQGEWAELFSGATNVKNRGMGLNQNNVYSLTSDKLATIVPKVLHDNATPAKVFVEIGRTDALNGTAAATIATNIETGVEKILSLSPNTKVYIQSIIPLRDATKNTNIVSPTNALLKTWCDSKDGVEYIDLYSSFIDTNSKLAAKYQSVYSAGYGANIALYRQWANLIADKVGATALPVLDDDYHAIKPSTSQTDTHWYTLTANGRYGGGPNRYVTSNGATGGLTGDLFNGKASQQWKFVAHGSGYDIISRATGEYIDPSSAANNNQLKTTASQPSSAWTVTDNGANQFVTITSGSVQLHQTNSALSHQIYNWGDGTDTGAGGLWYAEEAGYTLTESTQGETIEYLVVYDQGAKKWVTDNGKTMQSHADDIITSLNQCMINSHVNGSFHLAGVMEVPETYSTDTKEGLNCGVSSLAVKQKRAETKADIICVLIEHDPSNSITGSSNPAAISGVADDAVCCVRCSQAVAGFVAAHETAHIFGCGHSLNMADPGTPPAVAYENGDYSTLLSDVKTNHLLMLSGPGNYAANGTLEMGTDNANNAQQMRDAWSTVAGFSDSYKSYTLSATSVSAPSAGVTDKQITVSPNGASFNISEDYDWIEAYTEIESKSGTTHETNGNGGTDPIHITVSANTTGAARTGEIIIYASGYNPITITVTQQAEESQEEESTTPQISRTDWQISATWPHATTATTGDGGAAWIIDENADGTPNYNTWYHTDWSTNHGAVQGFMIDMAKAYNICKVHFEGRTTNGFKGLPTKYRLYAYETAPFALDAISVDNISSTNTALGTAVSSGSLSWTSSTSRQSCDISFDKTKARYVLFVWDAVTNTYPACSDFQVYRPASNPIDTYEEPRVGTTPDATEWNAISTGLHASWASRDELYSLHHVPSLTETSDTTINAWKGERANLEAVLFSNTDQGKLTLRTSSTWASARFLNYVITDDYKACGTHDMSLTQWLVPDVIDQDKAHSVPAMETRPVWCSIQVPRNIDAGKYTTTLKVLNESGQVLKTLNLTINVNEHSLPTVADQKFHLDLWQQPYAVSRYYGVERWSDEHIAALRQYLKALGDAGQKVVSAILFYEPWGDQSYDKFSAMIGTTKKSDGTWTYDYTIFDKWVELCAEYGIKDQIDCYSMVPWDMTFRYYDEAIKADVDLKTTTSSDDYKTLWTSFLTSFKAHLQQKGWFDKTCLAMDERGETDMLNAYNIASSLGFRMALAGNYHSTMVDKLQDYCLAPTQLQYYTTANQQYRKSNNLTTTFYTSCSESEPNVYTNSFPAEATYLPLFAAANDLDGYLHWSWLNWGESPLTDSRYRLFGSGDTYMYYPGNRSSVRFERLVEGIHQFEKIQILKTEYENNTSKMDSLSAVLKFCKEFAIAGEDCAAAVNRVEDFLNGKSVDIPETLDGYWKIKVDDTHYAKSAANLTQWSTEMSSQTDFDLFRIEGTKDACTIKLIGRSNNVGPDKNMQMFVDQTASTRYSIIEQADGKVKLQNNGYWVYVNDGTFTWSTTNSTEFELIYVMDAKDPVRTTLFSTLSGGMDIPPYRIPGISCGKNGRLIATAARLVCGTDPGYGQVDVVCRLSDDNGQTWSEIKDVAVGDASLINNVKTPMEAAYGDPAVVYDRESDEVLVMAVGGCTVFTNSTTNRQNPNIIASIRSLNGGNTWQTPIDQAEDIYSLFDSGNALAAAFVGGGKLFQSRIVKVGQYYRIYAALAARPNGNRVIYSDDFGRTWKALGGASALPVPSGDEPKCEELPDGRVIITSRVASGRYFNIYDYTDQKTGAGTWESVTKCTFSGLSVSPSSNPTNGELLIVPVRRNSDDKDMYLAMQSVPTGSSRVNVGIFYKELLDDTDMQSVTEFSTAWDGFYQVSSTVSAYSSLDLQADNKIGFFYEETLTKWGTKANPVSTSFPTGSGTHNYDGFENIYVPLDLELITGGRYSIRSVTPTGIDEISGSKFQVPTSSPFGEVKGETVYDLQGRRATFPQKGTIYVSNGQKAVY